MDPLYAEYPESNSDFKSYVDDYTESKAYDGKYGGLVSNFAHTTLNDHQHYDNLPPLTKNSKQEHIRLPLSSKDTLCHFRRLLTEFEQLEIHSYDTIYYAGKSLFEKIGTSKRRTGADLHDLMGLPGTTRDKDRTVHNSGYDDARGDLYLTKNDHLGYRYEILSLLGKGSFGQVAKCFDHKLKSHVAIKIIRNKERFEKQGEIEAKVLELLSKSDGGNTCHLVHMKHQFHFRGHLCLVFDLLGLNLYEYIKAGGFRGIHLGLVAEFAQQILACLKLLTKLQIIHCDLKPENVLITDTKVVRPSYLDANITSPASSRMPITPRIPIDFDPSLSKYDVKVIDFGSSCFETKKLYTYVQSRFYRAPEVILGLPYSTAIDMWSFGCLLAELYTGCPLFPGENEAEQLACIMEVQGLPKPEYLKFATRLRTFFDYPFTPRNLTNSKGKKRRPGSKSFTSMINCSDPAFIDLLERCLTWDPETRITAHEATLHPFVTGMNFEPVYDRHKRNSTESSQAYTKINNSESPRNWSRDSTLAGNYSARPSSIPSMGGHPRMSSAMVSKPENRKSTGFFGFSSSKLYGRIPKNLLPPILISKRFSVTGKSPDERRGSEDSSQGAKSVIIVNIRFSD